MPNPILDAARARLLAITAERAALDREERELRAMVAAAEGAGAQPWLPPGVTMPAPLVPLPGFTPALQPHPFWQIPGPIWYVDPTPRITCGEGWTSIRAEMPVSARAEVPTTIYVGDVNPSAGSVLTVGAQTIPTLLTISQN